MNQKLITYGKVFQLLGLHKFSQILENSNNARVTFTHAVGQPNMENFRQIVEYLCRVRTALSPEQFFAAYCGKVPFRGRSFLMTFDDGLLSSYRAAKDVLVRYGIKAIFFVPTAILELKTEEQMRLFAAEHIYYCPQAAKTLTADEVAFMSTGHLKDLVSEGHMVCPHTHNHVFLKDINDENAAKRELLAPKEILQDLLHRKINAFAFPVGTEKQAGRYAYDFIQRNYAFCFTALNGTNTLKTSPHLLFRDCLPAEAPLYYIKMIMDGSYDIFYMRKMKRLINSVQGKKIRNINSSYKSSKHMDTQNSLTGQQNIFNPV